MANETSSGVPSESELQQVAGDNIEAFQVDVTGDAGDGVASPVAEDIGYGDLSPQRVAELAADVARRSVDKTPAAPTRRLTVREKNAIEAEHIRRHNRRKMGIYDDDQ